ncbi:MAG: gamma-glutamyltransferase [Saprospiraceae bacterium]|nr:gamma-glutamyltransferase [Saprospiraceae bacterium]
MFKPKFLTKSILLILTIILILFIGCKQEKTEKGEQDKLVYPQNKKLISDKAMVVSAHPLASKVGMDILKKGGNAIDAAIAVQMALGVTYPVAGNIGGGGFMVIRMNDGTVDALDYREKAPLAAHRDMYLDSLGEVIPRLSLDGHLAVGVPGTVDGMVKAFEKYSQLKNWKELIKPSWDLAKDGILLTESEANGLNRTKEKFEKFNTSRPVFIKEDGKWEKGEKLVQSDLAKTFKSIHDKGRAGFYEGEVANQLVAEMKAGNGIITHEDLKQYEAQWRKPIVSKYKNYDIISMAPPSSGGIALTQMLGMVENYPIKDWGFHSPQTIHVMAEAERRAFADRAKHLGDPDFYDVPVKELMDKNYLKQRMSNFNPNAASPSDEIQAGMLLKESDQTTHFSIIDAEGNAVSVTTTLNTGYGSKVVVSGAGFFLNNEMDDLSAKVGVPNIFGLVGEEANAIEPGKRMLSSMTPTIATKNGKLNMVIGTPGGSTIITSVFQIFLNVTEFGMGMSEAINAPRFHHQWLPDQIFIETDAFPTETISALEKIGHKVGVRGSGKIGRFEGILVMPDGKLEGGADIRGDDSAMGY